MSDPDSESSPEGAAHEGGMASVGGPGRSRLGACLEAVPLPFLRFLAVSVAFGSLAFPATGLFFVGGLDSWRDLFTAPEAIWIYAPSLVALFLAVTRTTRAALVTVVPLALAVVPTLVMLFAETVAITHGRETGVLLRLAPVPSLLLQGALIRWLGPWAARRFPEGRPLH